MEINYHISPYPTLNEAMIARAYETQSPLAIIASQTIPTPHNAPATIIFTGLDRVPHIIRLFTNSGTLLHEFDILPTENTVSIFDPLFFKIGDGAVNTPLEGSAMYVNAALTGKTNADLLVFGNGVLKFPGIDYDTDLTGGFHLLQAGDIFENNTQWLVQQKPLSVLTYVNDSVVGKQFGGFVDVDNVAVSYIPAHLRKLIRLSGANGQYTFPAGAAIPVGYVFRFENHGAYSLVNDTPTIFFNNAAVKFGNTTINTFALPFKNIAEFTFDGTFWNVTIDCKVTTQASFASIVYAATYAIGNVANVNDLRTINIPLQVDTNYMVIGCLRSLSANPDNDNDVTVTIAQKALTQFNISLREYVPNNQNLVFDFTLLRMN